MPITLISMCWNHDNTRWHTLKIVRESRESWFTFWSTIFVLVLWLNSTEKSWQSQYLPISTRTLTNYTMGNTAEKVLWEVKRIWRAFRGSRSDTLSSLYVVPLASSSFVSGLATTLSKLTTASRRSFTIPVELLAPRFVYKNMQSDFKKLPCPVVRSWPRVETIVYIQSSCDFE